MIAQIATLVCAAAMALSLSVEADSFFHSPVSTTDSASSASDDDESTVEPQAPSRAEGPSIRR